MFGVVVGTRIRGALCMTILVVVLQIVSGIIGAPFNPCGVGLVLGHQLAVVRLRCGADISSNSPNVHVRSVVWTLL